MPGEIRAASFAALYGNHARAVYRFALYLCGNRALAQDITSETFLRVWVREQPVRLDSVRSWLLVIARNIYLHELRHLSRRTPLHPGLPAAESILASVEAKETLDQVLKALCCCALWKDFHTRKSRPHCIFPWRRRR